MVNPLRRFREFIEEVRWEDATSPKWWVNFLRRQVRLYSYVARETVRDRCLQQAAALTFTTLLSLVPLFAVAFSLFRGFEAFKTIEKKVERTIFRTVLAAPLVEGVHKPSAEAEGAGAGARALAEMSAEDLLKRAGVLPRMSAADEALALYLQALEKGGDASHVRAGLGTLYFTSTGLLREQAKRLSPAAIRAYRVAAEAPEVGGEQRKLWRERMHSFASGVALQEKQDCEGALREFQHAERVGYPLWKTRTRIAQVHVLLADRFWAEHDYAAACDWYRSAAANFADAFILSAGGGDPAEADEAVDEHNKAVRAQGGCLLELARRDADLYRKLAHEAPAAADASLDKTIELYTVAAFLLEDSVETEKELGDVLWAAERKEEGREHYIKAIERRKAAAARSFTTVVLDYLRVFSDRIGSAGLGMINVLFLVLAATSLFGTVEKTLNHIWQVTEKRPFWIKFTSFCTIVWLGPALIGVSILLGEKLSLQLAAAVSEAPVIGTFFSVGAAVMHYALPFVTVWLVLVAVYKFVPHTRVHWDAAAWGAFVAALFLQIARPGFRLYIVNAVKYETIYGSLGAIPIFLLWVWLLWVIVLFGAEVSFTVQNMGLLRFQDRLRRRSHLFVDRYLASRVMMYVAREFYLTGKSMHVAKLSGILQIPPEEAADAAAKLVKLGLLTPVGEELDEFHPARDLTKLKVLDVLNVTHPFRDELRSSHDEDKLYEEELEKIFNVSMEAQQEALHDLSFRELLERCQKKEEATGGPPPVTQQGQSG